MRDESEKELAERRKEVQRQERRIQQREESLVKKESLEQKEDAIAEKKQQAEAFLLEAEGIKANQFEILERISGFTAEQAK